MSDGPSIRLASDEDRLFIRETCRSYLSPTLLTEMIGRGDVVMSEVGAEPVGYAALDRLGAVSPFLAAIHVLAPFRRRGLGRALLADLEQRVLLCGHDVLYSSSSADEADPQAWHRRVGFEECGFVAGFNAGGVGEIIFRKRLRSHAPPRRPPRRPDPRGR